MCFPLPTRWRCACLLSLCPEAWFSRSGGSQTSGWLDLPRAQQKQNMGLTFTLHRARRAGLPSWPWAQRIGPLCGKMSEAPERSLGREPWARALGLCPPYSSPCGRDPGLRSTWAHHPKTRIAIFILLRRCVGKMLNPVLKKSINSQTKRVANIYRGVLWAKPCSKI